MRSFIGRSIIVLTLFATTSCNQSTGSMVDEEVNVKIIELNNQVEQLKLENAQKDSVINESISFFNEVQANLAKISLKENEIRIVSTDPEISDENKTWILEEIQEINFLRNENAKAIRNLRNEISKNNLQIEELNNMINRLVSQIQDKDQQISVLQKALIDKDMEYASLFDEYQEQVELALDVMKEMNKVYFVYGTNQELIDNNIIVKEGGFIGIGRETSMADDFNEKYFEEFDKFKVNELPIIGKKPKLITDHPSSSYQLEDNKIKILDPERFWKVSKYLVIEVK
ncbi:MAG: hypothetical protein WC994_00375 [Brumimicrobium sp.]